MIIVTLTGVFCPQVTENGFVCVLTEEVTLVGPLTSRNMAGILFEDIFDVKDIDPDGKKFDRGEEQWDFASVSRTLVLNTVVYTSHIMCVHFPSVFPAVSRLHCESESFKMDLILDVNTQIYPVDLGVEIYTNIQYAQEHKTYNS